MVSPVWSGWSAAGPNGVASGEWWAVPVFAWATSRLLVLIAMGLIAPQLPFPGGNAVTLSPELLAPWDGGWYGEIAKNGYEFAPGGDQHSLAFFPLYPLLMRGAMAFGAPWVVAGVLLNNLSFLGALILLHRWASERYDVGVARWAVAILAYCPYSLFAALVYSEGLFLLLSLAALWAFDRQLYGLAAVAGALATATRVTALPLVAAMALVAWRERRGAAAYGAAFATGLGLLAFIAYCALAFGAPLGFLEAQYGWRSALGFDWMGGLNALSLGFFGTPVPGGTIVAVIFLGGLALLGYHRTRLPAIGFWYGLGALTLILSSGSLVSIDRYVYGVAPISLALALSLARHLRWGGAVLVYFVVTLLGYGARLAQGLWVA